MLLVANKIVGDSRKCCVAPSVTNFSFFFFIIRKCNLSSKNIRVFSNVPLLKVFEHDICPEAVLNNLHGCRQITKTGTSVL